MALVILCVLAASVIVGRILMKDGRLKIPFLAGAAGAGESPARVVYVTRFSECGDEIREFQTAPAGSVPALLTEVSPEWTLVKNTDLEVELTREIPGYCGTHLRKRFITLYKGHVCVFRGGGPEPKFIHKEIPSIKETDLIQAVREELRKGILLEAGPEIPDAEVDDWFEERVAIELEGIDER